MSLKNPHGTIDRIVAEQDRLVAVRLRKDSRVLHLARRNLKRWMAGDKHPRRVFSEWNLVLTRLSAAEIADFLESNTPMARRLSGWSMNQPSAVDSEPTSVGSHASP